MRFRKRRRVAAMPSANISSPCPIAVALRGEYVKAIDGDTEARRAGGTSQRGMDQIAHTELRLARDAAHDRLVRARRRYWEHVEGHGCRPDESHSMRGSVPIARR